MYFKKALAGTLLLGCISCVENDNGMGGNMVPVSQTYKICKVDPITIPMKMEVADSLSGFSSTRITIGSLRKESEFGLTERACALNLLPFMDTLDFGESPKFKSFHFASALDTVSMEDENQRHILQKVKVFELTKPVTSKYDYDLNADAPHGTVSIVKGNPVLNGTDSLSFNFTEAYGEKFFALKQEDLKDIASYRKKIPGIYITTDSQHGDGGRINSFELQLNFDTDYMTVSGNYAELKFSAVYDGERIDTSFLFLFSPDQMYDVDSLLTNVGQGSLPLYCKNITFQDKQKTEARRGPVKEEAYIEGGGGLKPVISAVHLKKVVSEAIAANGDDPTKAIINKATLSISVAQPDANYELMYKVPQYLSPTVRVHVSDTTEKVTVQKVEYGSLTDASASDENQGDLNRSLFKYTPDITYHMQSILALKDDSKSLLAGEYDIWMLILADEVVTTTSSSDSDLSDYYTSLAYQSYYNSMYGGYGSGYGDSYTNYYTYMMMAQYASSSSTSENTETLLDKDRYYCAKLYGPECKDETLRPTLEFTYSVPNK